MGIDYGMTGIVLDEDVDLKNYSVWICDIVHGYPAWTPLYISMFCEVTPYGMQYACEALSCPESKGWEWKLHDGYVYITAIEARAEEIPAREKLFRQRLASFLEDLEGRWAKDRDRIWGLYKHIQEVDIGKVSPCELRGLVWEAWDVFRKSHEIHFYWKYGLYILDNQFVTACEEIAGIKPDDPIHARLRSGFDNTLFQTGKEMWALGSRARELGLGNLFLTTADDEMLLAELSKSAEGRKWLDEYSGFLKIRGWRCQRMVDWATPSWIEKPSLGLADIKRYMSKEQYVPEVEREGLAKERQSAEEELFSKVPAGDQQWFKKLLRAAQMSASWTEDHTPFCELGQNAVTRKVIWEVGNRFARAGVIDEPFDVFMLMPWEIRKAIGPLERVDYRKLARWRRSEWEKALKKEPQPFLGNIEKLGELAAKDPIIRVVGAPPNVRPELKADLYGAGGAPGMAEGSARVIMSEAQFDEIQQGEILVAPFTSSPWIAVFHLVKGVVTDMGGSMAHAVIMGREFGLPVVAGTLEGTKKIKTGQRIRIDGANMAVYIL
ncbi:MAG: PEP-utilizing enzyme [Syntrophorhabdales bacterium]|jgi:phosphohistidine swiveling domain-containing protein